ncbi:MAG TPA: ESX secretion-associated protein EspG [Pseudonocardiaceae bacterium]|nr:ESX secretion-associated protein EspG [Pseudonocardiaceae bacterium]
MTDFAFSLSLAAIDLLWEQLRLGTPVRIFEVPSVGATIADRDRLRQIVLTDLASRDLAYRGRLEPEVEEALVTLARFQQAIDAVGILDDEERLLARAATDGRTAVLARLQDQTVRFETFRAAGLVPETVKLIGEEKPGPGRSVTFPEPNPEAERRASLQRRRDPDEGFQGVFDSNRPQQGGYELERRAAQTMWERPRKRIGMFTVYGRDRAGREVQTPVLSWFDTDDGRYIGHSRPGPDGQQWTTYTPADSSRISQQLVTMLSSVDQPPPTPGAHRR